MYHSVKDLVELSDKENKPMWRIIMEEDARQRQVSEEASFENMRQMYIAMKSADKQYDGSMRSASGLAGGDGEKLHSYNQTGRNIAGPYLSLVMEKAVKMGESNACMKRIVAAPTAG